MAKRASRGSRGASSRQPKAKSKKAKKAPAAAVEVVEESPGENVDGGILIATTIALLAAILFVDKMLGSYDAGVFF